MILDVIGIYSYGHSFIFYFINLGLSLHLVMLAKGLSILSPTGSGRLYVHFH
jgi:hypothetical protein